MKVLHVGMCCTYGGAESVVATLIREQVSRGVEVEVAFRYDWGASKQFGNACPVRFLNEETLGEVLLRKQFDVVHTVTHAADWLAPALDISKYDGAVIVTSHACGFYETRLKSDLVVAVSRAVADSIRNIYHEKLRVIYNGINCQLFYPAETGVSDVRTICWIGRANDPVKGFDLFLEFLNSQRPNQFRIVVVDGSPPENEARKLLPKCVSYHPRKDWFEMPSFYRALAASNGILLSTSRMEAFGMNILEAQACGCPVVAPNVGGIPEIIQHKKTGFLYNRGQGVKGIEEAIHWVYTGRNHERVSLAASRSVVQGFNAGRMCDGYEAVYAEAMSRYRARNYPSVMRRNLAWAKHIGERKARSAKRRLQWAASRILGRFRRSRQCIG